jgi:choline kinase
MIEVGGVPVLDRLLGILKPLIPDIRIVVGYREEMIIDHCSKYHRSIVIARNPDYRATNAAQSLSIGAPGISGKTLFIDGDMILSPSSLHRFLDQAVRHDHLVGVTQAKSENAVFAQIATSAAGAAVSGFSRSVRTNAEWANLVTGPSTLMDGAVGFIFERLESLLPLPCAHVELAEIDTPGDLEAAHRFISASVG